MATTMYSGSEIKPEFAGRGASNMFAVVYEKGVRTGKANDLGNTMTEVRKEGEIYAVFSGINSRAVRVALKLSDPKSFGKLENTLLL